MTALRKCLRLFCLVALLLFTCPPSLVGRASPEPPLAPDAPGQGRDGFDELFIGVPEDDVYAPHYINWAGIVHAIYGASTGLTSLGNQLWSQDSPGVEDQSEVVDGFGDSLAAGDFNGDARIDLAVGAATEFNEALMVRMGSVNVLYGTEAGLSADRDQFWHQGLPTLAGEAEDGDLFGWSLAAGDFNRDGYTDLAIGVPAEDVGAVADAGAVNVLYGSPAGLTGAGNQLWHQDVPGVEDAAETVVFGEGFGLALAAGDFNCDLYVDLAIGVPREGIGSVEGAGAVNVLYGSSAGLTADGDQLWSQDSPAVEDSAEANDRLGLQLAAGDFNTDRCADLVVSSNWENIAEIINAGAVMVLPGSITGLTAAGSQFIYQGYQGLPGAPGSSDRLGTSLSTGDYNRDGFADLAIGVPYDSEPTNLSAGIVHVIYGSPTGLDTFNNQYLSQETPGVEDTSENPDDFGSALASGDYNGDGFADLAVSAPGETLTVGGFSVGALNVLYGSVNGLDGGFVQYWHEDSPDILGSPFPFDDFGSSLASSDCPTCRYVAYFPLMTR